MTNLSDSKTGQKYEVGMPVKIYDSEEGKIINGIITEVGDETICIQWEDLKDDTEYEISQITLKYGELIKPN